MCMLESFEIAMHEVVVDMWMDESCMREHIGVDVASIGVRGCRTPFRMEMRFYGNSAYSQQLNGKKQNLKQ
jgi:hypothetical protein